MLKSYSWKSVPSTKNFTFNCKISLIIVTIDDEIFLLYYIYQRNISHTTFIKDRQKKSVPAKILQKKSRRQTFPFYVFFIPNKD